MPPKTLSCPSICNQHGNQPLGFSKESLPRWDVRCSDHQKLLLYGSIHGCCSCRVMAGSRKQWHCRQGLACIPFIASDVQYWIAFAALKHNLHTWFIPIMEDDKFVCVYLVYCLELPPSIVNIKTLVLRVNFCPLPDKGPACLCLCCRWNRA